MRLFFLQFLFACVTLGCNSSQQDPAAASDSLTIETNANVLLPAVNGDSAGGIIIREPLHGSSITSPLTITGRARGTWFFEASFPIELFDSQNKLVGQGIAQADSIWMTENYVPFTASIEFAPPPGKKGTLVFSKDNPSGLEENAGSFSLPVIFP